MAALDKAAMKTQGLPLAATHFPAAIEMEDSHR
jgi:hypothetical protein